MRQGTTADVNKVKSEVLGEEPKDGTTLVHTKVQSDQDTAAIDYVMEKRGKSWRAVDVITEGVSLVDTYKDQVNKLIPKKGVNGVIDALQRARKRLEEQQDKPATAQDSAPAQK
jgi:ABC-type transporter MlaC component